MALPNNEYQTQILFHGLPDSISITLYCFTCVVFYVIFFRYNNNTIVVKCWRFRHEIILYSNRNIHYDQCIVLTAAEKIYVFFLWPLKKCNINRKRLLVRCNRVYRQKYFLPRLHYKRGNSIPICFYQPQLLAYLRSALLLLQRRS